MRTILALNAASFASLLAVCGFVHAQTARVPSAGVTVAIREGTPEYCLDLRAGGPDFTGRPSDVTLRLPIRLRYVNHRSDTIYLPRGYGWQWRMTIAGQNEPTILRQGGGGAYGLDVKSLMALSRPEAGPFWVVPAGRDDWSTVPNLSVLKYKDTVDDEDFVLIRVLDRSLRVDLRGTTVQIATTRDFRSIPPDVVEMLNEKWNDYGTVLTPVVESDPLTVRIPEQPLTRSCLPAAPK